MKENGIVSKSSSVTDTEELLSLEGGDGVSEGTPRLVSSISV
jgi:hypothetical protein